MARKVKSEKVYWIILLELFSVTLGFLFLLPTAFLIAFVVLIYFMVGSVLTNSDLTGLQFKRRVKKDRISYEDELTVEETLRNESPKPVFIEVLSPLHGELQVSEGSNHYLVHLRGKETRRIRYKIRPSYHGNFTIQKAQIRTVDYLVSSYEEVVKESQAIFSVYPVLEELKKFPSNRMSVIPYQGAIQSKSPGPGTEFFEIRDYIPTDEFKKINWKASARSQTLLSNEYENERMADIYMILDSTNSSLYFLKDYTRVCLSFVDFFLKMGNRVGLVIIGKYWTWISSGSGRRQLVRLAESILEERPEDPLPSTYPIENTIRSIPRISSVIVFSSMRNQIIKDTVGKLAEYKQKTIAIIPSSTSGNLAPENMDPPWVALAKQLIRLERENASKFLKSINVPLVEWDPKLPMSTTLEALGGWMSRREMITS
jgi:uncharacterized protein (DUF58 family)